MDREHVDIVAEKTNLIRKKITQRTGKHTITVGRETTSLTVVISSNTLVEAKKTNDRTENRIRKFIRKMTDRSGYTKSKL